MCAEGKRIMSSALKYLVIAVIGSLSLISTSIRAQSSDVFPEVEGWTRGEVKTYPRAELGYGIAYKSGVGGTVSFYVYNGGLKSMADGSSGASVINERAKAEGDIFNYGKQGHYENVQRVRSETVNLGYNKQVSALYSLFSFKIRATEVDSSIYIFGYQNNFIKVRSTHPANNTAADIEVNKLISRVVDNLP
jgi:hypothetical protein